MPLVGRELEGVDDRLDRARVLLHEQLQRGVDEHGPTVIRAQEVGHILRDGDQPQVVLASAPRHCRDEGAALGIAQQRPRLVDHEQPRPALLPDAPPDEGGDQVDGQRPQLLLELLDVEHDQVPIQLDVGRTGEQTARQRAVDEAPKPGRQTGGRLARAFPKDAMQIAQQWRGSVVRGSVLGDAARGVGGVQRVVEDRALEGASDCRRAQPA